MIKKEYIYLGNMLVSVRYNNANYYVYNDISGRPDYVTNSGGTAVWKAHNQAFYRTVKINSIADLNLGYAGQYYDKETDTWYNLNRDYDAKAGRYLQSDPQGTVDGPNTYVYAGNNPVNRVDPTGEAWFVIVPIALDIGIAMAQNGGDLSKVDYKTILLDAVSLPGPLKSIKWVKAGAKHRKNADNIQKNDIASNELSANNGNVANSAGKKIPNCDLCAPNKRGNAPIGKDGHSVELHHRNQKPDGPLDEMTRTDHRLGDNFKKNHPNTGQDASQIDRKSWRKEQKNYWKKEWDGGRFDDM